ncbi:ABC transporter substrate-binding protein [Verrucomicrobiales bacterium]|nr:ABC transporter substrate-binding protein [Verrucomicrobiales bacterium]MDB4358833.1 ABC transporter substrate-binding protein [Verrucomicrobiales bacterium]
MFLLRAILYAFPIAVVGIGIWLFNRVSDLSLSDDRYAMVCAIRSPVGYLDPAMPQKGITREITNLIFEPTLIRDDELIIRPNLIEDWSFQTVVVVRCASEEAAGEAEAMIRSGEFLGGGLVARGVDRSETVLTVAIEGFENGLTEKLIANIDPPLRGDYLLVKLSLRDSVAVSFETFLKASVEKTQIKMLEYDGDSMVNLFLKGDTDLFLRELELYYESNRSLDPEIEVVGAQCYTSFHEMEIKLRTDVRWHDGMRFGVDDVLYSYNRFTTPGSSLPLENSFWFVEDLIRVDDFTLKVQCNDEPVTMLESWEKLPIIPAHLFSKMKKPEEALQFYARPVGNGPYRFVERRRDGGVELEVNENYFRKPPLEKQLVYETAGSLESVLLAIRSNQLHVIVPDERFVKWTERNPGMVKSVPCLPRFQHFVAWNLDSEPFVEIEVRNALAKGVDLKRVRRDSINQFQQPSESLFYPAAPYCDEKMLLPLYDSAAAGRMLDEAGFTLKEGEAIRRDAEGNLFSFKLTVNEGNADHLHFAGELAAQWAALGVKVEIDPVSREVIMSERLATREFDALILNWELPLERDRYTTWHSSGIGGGSNLFGLRNQLVDETVTKLRYEEDIIHVKRLAARLQKEIADLQPCLFIGDSGRLITVREDSLEVIREGVGGEPIVQRLGVGKAGLERSRPWWVRKHNAEEEPLSIEP